MQCFRNFPVVKKVTDEGGGSRLSVEKFLSHKAEKNRTGILYCFTIFRHRKMLGIKERGVGGASRFSVEKFSSHSAEKILRATLLCSVSEIVR